MTHSCVTRLIHVVDTHTRKSCLTYFANNIRDVQPFLRVVVKEPYKIDDVLQKRPIILRSLLIVATPYFANNIRDVEPLLRVFGNFIALRYVCCSVLQCLAV